MNSLLQKLIQIESGPYSRWNVVPNLTSDAVYSFTTQIIELSNVDSWTYTQAVEGNAVAAKKVNVLLAHELRHWIDHVGTVWGQTLLCKGYNALHAREANDPYNLWRVISFQQALRDSRFNRYYTTIDTANPPDGILKWKYQMSAGARFDHRGELSELHPIVFTRFAWLNDTPACRVPLSLVSLLECSATFFEFKVEHAFLGSLAIEERHPASEALQQRFLKLAYDPHWAEYSVAAHAISNFVRPTTIPESYELASALAGVALNMVPSHFGVLRVPDSFGSWGKRNEAFLANADRGYAFLTLAKHAPQVPIHDVRDWVEETLARAGLPTLAALKRDAALEMQNLTENLLDGPLDKFRDAQLAAGRSLFHELGPLFQFKPVFERLARFDLPLPPIVLGQDLSIVANGTISEWDQSPVSKHIDFVLQLFNRCTEFAEACGF